MLLISDKSAGTSRKPGLEDSRGLVSMPGPGVEGREWQSAPGIGHFRAKLSKMVKSGKGAAQYNSPRSYVARFFPPRRLFLYPAF